MAVAPATPHCSRRRPGVPIWADRLVVTVKNQQTEPNAWIPYAQRAGFATVDILPLRTDR